MSQKIRAGILGATGTVGQKFVALLAEHPWFEVSCVAASERSAGKPYKEAVSGRWTQTGPVPEKTGALNVFEVETELSQIAEQADFVFSALSMEKARIREIESAFAENGLPVVSNNSAHRMTEDVPILIPEINPHHLALIDSQRKNRGWTTGLIVVKPNCSVQSYVPVLEALKIFGPEKVIVSTYQAISGAGKTLEDTPELQDNVIPFIGGEEQKSELEPLKIQGEIVDGNLVFAEKPVISTHCVRVPVSDGHLAAVNVSFSSDPGREELVEALRNFRNPVAALNLPSSPEHFLVYFNEDDRPQTRLDRDLGRGMTVSVGRLRPDPVLGWKFIALSHNTLRGAAGGGVLSAEFLTRKGYIGPR